MRQKLKVWWLKRAIRATHQHVLDLAALEGHAHATMLASVGYEMKLVKMLDEIKMSNSERMTRDAAKAIGIDQEVYVWDEFSLTLFLQKRHWLDAYISRRGFGPLHNESDALLLENMLKMSVDYRTLEKNATAIFMTTLDGHTSSTVVYEGQDTLKHRMWLAVRAASLCHMNTSKIAK